MLIPRNVRLLSVTRAYYRLPPARTAGCPHGSGRVFSACLERCFCGGTRAPLPATTGPRKSDQLIVAGVQQKWRPARQETCGRYRGSASCGRVGGGLFIVHARDDGQRHRGRGKKRREREAIFIHAYCTLAVGSSIMCGGSGRTKMAEIWRLVRVEIAKHLPDWSQCRDRSETYHSRLSPPRLAAPRLSSSASFDRTVLYSPLQSCQTCSPIDVLY